MTAPSVSRRLVAETLGSAFLLAAVAGSGIMAARLSDGNDALALLCNTVATGAALVVLISIFASVSGAHFNPAVTLYFALRHEISPPLAIAYAAVQTGGAILGVWAAHAMFGMAIFELSHRLRDGPSQWLSESIATFGLLATIAGSKHRPDTTPPLVGLYIGAAYWFTASTSFANPAVTIARALTDSFAGIAPASVLGFLAAQIAATVAAFAVNRWLFPSVAIRE